MAMIRRISMDSDAGLVPSSVFSPWQLFDIEPRERTPQCHWSPRANILEGQDYVVIMIELPGIALEAIKIEVQDDVMTVSGERNLPQGFNRYCRVESSVGTFCRSFTLNEAVDPGHVNAKLDKGILKISVLKKGSAMHGQVKVVED